MNGIILYTTHCPKCKVIETKLTNKNVQFDMVDDVNIIRDAGITEVPVLEVKGERMNFLAANKYVNSL